MFFCPDGFPPNSGLTGPNNIYIYIYVRGLSEKYRDFVIQLIFYYKHLT